MRHQNSLLHDLLKFVPWHRFDTLVDEYNADRRVRRLSTKSQFIALLHGQLSGAQSLREIEVTTGSHAARFYHLGATVPKRSTLADANAKRPADLFADLFSLLLAQAKPGLRRHIRDAVQLLDATCVPLRALSQSWAREKTRGAGAKMHVVFDLKAQMPVHFDVTPARTNDIEVAKALDLTPGTTYVFDMGYYDFGWWRRLHDTDCRFVTRLKRHTRPKVIEERPVEPGGAILADRVIAMNRRMKANRKNPLADVPLREIVVVIETGKKLRIVSNDLDASAEEIADLYKARWKIELFFKWVKQNLKIRRFIGTSEAAVRTQIAVALIAFLLLKIAFKAQSAVSSLLAFTRLVRAQLLNFRSIHQLVHPPPSIRHHPAQNELALC